MYALQLPSVKDAVESIYTVEEYAILCKPILSTLL